MSALDVYCDGTLVGTLEDARDGLRFAYDETWRAAGHPPLSQSLPLHGELLPEAVDAFFAGLLPEGRPRRQLARTLGISEGNDFALLEALGGDCPGAISLYPAGGDKPEGASGADVRWLSDAEVATLIETLPERPMLAEEDGEIRLSLAGAQDKLPVVFDGERIGVTAGRTPSTHILKTPIPRYEGTIANEALCLALGHQFGIRTAVVQPWAAAGGRCLLVERYDRERERSQVRRLHQEDFCQALAVPPARKYQAHGGPSLDDCFELVRRATNVPGRHLPLLLDAVALNFLVGNHDAHGKNFSLLYRAGTVEMAPLYDILSTAVYPGLSRKMAMKMGGENRPDYVESRHIDRMLEGAGLAIAASRNRLSGIAAAAPQAVRQVRDELAAEGWGHPVLDTVVEIVDRRAARLAKIAAPRAHARLASPAGERGAAPL
jgi:serine/threonine-protein kinase HipA